jgi:hypothetical protein
VKSLLALFLSFPFILIYFSKASYDEKFPFIVATVILYNLYNFRYSLLSVYYTYYEKYIENNCFILFKLKEDKKLKDLTLGLRSEIKLYSKFYNLSLYDQND